MCGIAGIARREPAGVSPGTLARMGAAIRHRGPDAATAWSDAHVGLAHVRLSIIDLATGDQPMFNEDGSKVIVFNGEIYNYLELREELVARGHRFTTHSDTEVLLHGWEEWGPRMFARLNGMWAFALWDRRARTLVLSRDRFGKRPLFYAEPAPGTLVFGSEVKAIFASGEVPAAPSLEGLDEVFTFWAARAPRTVFEGVWQVMPGGYALWKEGCLTHHTYWAPSYDEAATEAPDTIERLDATLRESVRLRMRADVPVGGYLSGGLDSSITCALAQRLTPHALRTFSITFADPQFDESPAQLVVAKQVGSEHHVAHVARGEIAEVFPEVVRHAETPLLRTAPAPMYLLSKLARDHDIKVVLSGEGSDEVFLGYDLFKETKVRLFCLRQPQSQARPRLFDRLYPYLGDGRSRGGEMWRNFFLTAGGADDPLFSHLPRFLLTSRIREFYSAEARLALGEHDALERLRQSLPVEFASWSPLNRAAYLEITTLLSGYLLSSQGDRMAMAHGVELRSPFLDVQLAEFAAGLPTGSKLAGLREKDVLRRWAASVIPPAVLQRGKQPYRAPDIPAFFAEGAPEWVEELLTPDAIRRGGLFEPAAVQGLVRRCRSGRATGFAENQALVAILSTQLWHQSFFDAPAMPSTFAPPAVASSDRVLVPSTLLPEIV